MIDSGTLTGNDTIEIAVSPVEFASQGVKRKLITEDIGDNSGGVELQASPDDGASWFTHSSVTLGTPLEFNAYPGERFQLVVTNGTTPDMNYWVL